MRQTEADAPPLSQRVAGIVRDRAVRVEDLAEQVGISRSSMYRVLSGRRPATVDEWEKIAHALGIDPADLWAEGAPAAGAA